MKSIKLTFPMLALAGLALAGCPSDDVPPESDSSSGEDSTTAGPATTPMTGTTMNTTEVADSTTTVGPTTDTETDTAESSTTGPEIGPFEFDETPFEDYLQVDRMGFPAVNTGLNLLGDKDAYNVATPSDDASNTFITNIRESIETLHIGAPGSQTPDNTGLNDDLLALGLAPCSHSPAGSCLQQGGPFVIPDTLKINLDQPAGFPNGRQLDAPVMDIILAVLLLDLDAHAITTFLDLDGDMTPGPSLNPLTNDVPFDAAFPYLAPAHE